MAPRVVGFEKRTFWRHECIGREALDLPELRMETVGLDIQLPETTTERAAKAGLDCRSGWVGASNALLGVLPGFVMCEDSDVAASWPDKVPPFYDRYPGGLGYVEKLYHIIEDVWQAAYELVRDCPCQNGCPACVGVLPPRWEVPAEGAVGKPFVPGMEIHGAGEIADKKSALFIFRDVLGLPQPEPSDAPDGQPPAQADRQEAFARALDWAVRLHLKGIEEDAIILKLRSAGWREVDVRELLGRMALYFE